MRRITAHAAVAVIVGGLLSPVASLAITTPASADTYGAETTVVGNGRGLSGPASRALLGSGPVRMDAAPDGSVLVTDQHQVLRVQPVSDTVTVVPGSITDQTISDVAAAGSAVLFVDATGLHRAAGDGATTTLLARTDVAAVDVGSDGVVWVATTHDVLRILTDGTVVQVPPAVSKFGFVLDLAVTPNGSTSYVLDDGAGRYGVYPVTAAGVGTRVAGNLQEDHGLPTVGVPATSASTETANALTTDGTTISLAYAYHDQVLRFAVGGVLTQVVSGACAEDITTRGTELVAYCKGYDLFPSLHRLSSSGADLGRILGEAPEAPWSPDGVRATDAYTDTVRGAAGLPDGRIVFTTQHGLVREVGTDGRLRTRATLAPIASRGKVAIGSDGTAYVVTDAGGVVQVPASGPADPLSVDADATDVAVVADSLVVADGTGKRLLRLPRSGGAATVLTALAAAPKDVGVDGSTVLVADAGLRRVADDGSVTTLLSGGDPTVAAAIAGGGVWTNPLVDHDSYVLLPDGSLSPVRVEFNRLAQVEAVTDGTVLLSGDQSVRRVTDPGLPEAVPTPTLSATGGGGQILLGWDWRTAMRVIAKPGATPPADFEDGTPISFSTVGDPASVDTQHLVLRVGDHVLQAGEQWSFAAFSALAAPISDNASATRWSAAATATATVLADDTPPGPAVNPSFGATRTTIFLAWTSPSDADLAGSVVRMALGTTAPATPDDGTAVPISGSNSWYPSLYLPDPQPDQDYAVSIFTVDLHGNYTRWSGVARLDTVPPAPVTDVQVTPSYKYANFSFTPPPDSDYASARYAVSPGSGTPSFQNSTYLSGSTATAWGLTMGSDYTLAIWSTDRNGNVSEPVITHFTALLDTQPPGPVTALSVIGGDYQVTATWTPPTDSDLDKLTARLTDTATGAVTSVSLAKTATGYTWSRLPGGLSKTVTVFATDVNGLTSDVSTADGATNPDANGTPPPVDPATVTVTPRSSTSVTVSFPKPAIPDLRNIGYAAVPLGQDPDSFTTVAAMATSATGANLVGVVNLPQPVTGYQLVLFVYDLNGNRSQSVGPQVKGAPNASELPVGPVLMHATSPADSTVSVAWANFDPLGTRASSWTVTATAGSLTRTVTVPGAVMQAAFTDVPGRQNWTVSVMGTNPLGNGPVVTAAPVWVGDNTPPAPVTGATATPAADTELLSWVNPTAFDFDHVVVTKSSGPAESQIIYLGSGTSVRATGLLAGHAYQFEIEAYDKFGNVNPVPVTLTSLQSTLTLSGPTTLVYGSSATLTGSLTWNGTHPAGRVLSIQAMPFGATAWTQIATPTTSAAGTFAVTVRPSLNVYYRVGYAGSGGTGGAYSPARVIAVARLVSIQSNVTSLRLGGTVTLATTVAPGDAGGSVALERWTGSAWSIVVWRTLSSASTTAVNVRPPSRGINTYRWVTPSDATHASGAGASRQVQVY